MNVAPATSSSMPTSTKSPTKKSPHTMAMATKVYSTPNACRKTAPRFSCDSVNASGGYREPSPSDSSMARPDAARSDPDRLEPASTSDPSAPEEAPKHTTATRNAHANTPRRATLRCLRAAGVRPACLEAVATIPPNVPHVRTHARGGVGGGRRLTKHIVIPCVTLEKSADSAREPHPASVCTRPDRAVLRSVDLRAFGDFRARFSSAFVITPDAAPLRLRRAMWDLRSDTVTRPTRRCATQWFARRWGTIRRRPHRAEAGGDDGAGLRKGGGGLRAERNMGNLVAVGVHCEVRGSEYICGDRRIVQYEQGGSRRYGRAPQATHHRRGRNDRREGDRRCHPRDDQHFPRTTVVCRRTRQQERR